jgi:hypothetical protein
MDEGVSQLLAAADHLRSALASLGVNPDNMEQVRITLTRNDYMRIMSAVTSEFGAGVFTSSVVKPSIHEFMLAGITFVNNWPAPLPEFRG